MSKPTRLSTLLSPPIMRQDEVGRYLEQSGVEKCGASADLSASVGIAVFVLGGVGSKVAVGRG